MKKVKSDLTKSSSKKKTKLSSPVAVLRDGSTLEIGDEVETEYHKSCEGLIFIVETITPYLYCESGFVVVVVLKGHTERKILGLQKEGFDWPLGLDANHFKKIEKT